MKSSLALAARGHEASVELAISDGQMTQAVALVQPDVVICPFLESKLPEAIWRHTRSLALGRARRRGHRSDR
jgi:hypothetical protein